VCAVTASTVDLLTKAQLAELLGVSVPTLNRWRNRGDGPPGFHLVGDGMGSPVRFNRADVLAWLEERRTAGAYPPPPPPPPRHTRRNR
jgi:predicted DNA-binding transcriptional regulator AlpA